MRYTLVRVIDREVEVIGTSDSMDVIADAMKKDVSANIPNKEFSKLCHRTEAEMVIGKFNDSCTIYAWANYDGLNYDWRCFDMNHTDIL